MKIILLVILWVAFSVAYTFSFWAPKWNRKYGQNLKDKSGVGYNCSFTRNG